MRIFLKPIGSGGKALPLLVRSMSAAVPYQAAADPDLAMAACLSPPRPPCCFRIFFMSAGNMGRAV